jgi:taurine dioxygenase
VPITPAPPGRLSMTICCPRRSARRWAYARESQVLLEFLWEHVVRPEFTVRFRWEPGSVAFWDNRATAHLAPRDIFDSEFDRQFYRVTLVGDVPIGIDGKPSTALEGEPIVAV